MKRYLKENGFIIVAGLLTWVGLLYGGYVLFNMYVKGTPL